MMIGLMMSVIVVMWLVMVMIVVIGVVVKCSSCLDDNGGQS